MSARADLKTLLAQSGITASLAQVGQLEAYKQLALSWNEKLNLIAPSTVEQFDRRHIIDSAQLARYLPSHSCQVLDVGSGAGLPGLVLAVLCPQHKFTLAEKVQKKASFLVTAAHKLGLSNVVVHAGVAQTLPNASADIIPARALAEMADLLALTAKQLKNNGLWLLLKGEAVEQEIKALKAPLDSPRHLTIERHPSIVSATGCVLVARRVSEPSA